MFPEKTILKGERRDWIEVLCVLPGETKIYESLCMKCYEKAIAEQHRHATD